MAINVLLQTINVSDYPQYIQVIITGKTLQNLRRASLPAENLNAPTQVQVLSLPLYTNSTKTPYTV